MSDKSFGDYTNRNVVKNPLLSTAVTGLSIEDLTHNAVLLPAVPSQELITRQDPQHESQMNNSQHSEQDTTNFLSGDANSNITQFHTPANVNLNLQNNQKQAQNVKFSESHAGTQSKASNKSDDDFDVNEYFARLQGTRYVSAPLHSTIKDDQNANLQVEENLEEINLNEPDKTQSSEEIQQSLTADIAQNFSQLPTVLPHVASAVFSSFSNILNYKSREVTPDEAKTYHDAQTQKQELVNIPLNVPEAPVKEIGPPPLREPPTCGVASNYRIPTKKKVYAPIPGLSSGDHQHIQTLNSGPVSQIQSSYFVPETNISTIPRQSNQQVGTSSEFDLKPVQNIPENSDTSNNQKALEETKNPITLSNSEASDPIAKAHTIEMKPNISTSLHESESKVIVTQTYQEHVQPKMYLFNQTVQSQFEPPPSTHAQACVIPPPPMFSNMQRRDTQTCVEKAILPPSVARRLPANQPFIKSPTIENKILQENIFVPTLPSESNITTNIGSDTPLHPSCSQLSAETLFIPSTQHNLNIDKNSRNFDSSFEVGSLSSSLKTSNLQSCFEILPNNPLVQSIPSLHLPNSTGLAGSQVGISSFVPDVSEGSELLSSTSFFPQPSNLTDTSLAAVTPKPISDLSDLIPTTMPENNIIPASNIFKEYSTSLSQPSIKKPEKNLPCLQTPSSTNIAQPIFFNPGDLAKNNIDTLSISEIRDDSIKPPLNNSLQSMNMESTPPKLIPEPPKLTGNLNYRMAKKKPQYYSGPIEGFGSISNNTKPILNPVEPDYSYTSLFTPDQSTQPTSYDQKSNYNLPNIQESVPSFDLSKPFNTAPPPSYGMNVVAEQPIYNDYNTAFDLSRSTTEKYDQSQQEKIGFGIIGSLKSKLSSIDINKIQNTVTTFFDPAYNDTKVDGSGKHENTSYCENKSVGSYQNFPPNESSTLELFVPNLEEQMNTHPYQTQTNYMPFINQNQLYYQPEEFTLFDKYQNPNNSSWYDNSKHQALPASALPLSSSSHVTDINNKDRTTETLIKPEYYNSNIPMTMSKDSVDNPNKNVTGNENVSISDSPHTTHRLFKNITGSQELSQIDTKNIEISTVTKYDTDLATSNIVGTIIPHDVEDRSIKNFFADSVPKPKTDFGTIISQDTIIADKDLVYAETQTNEVPIIKSAFDFNQPINLSALQSKKNEASPKITQNHMVDLLKSSRTRTSPNSFFDNLLPVEQAVVGKAEKNKESGNRKMVSESKSLSLINPDLSSESYFEYQFDNPGLGIGDNKDIGNKEDFYGLSCENLLEDGIKTMPLTSILPDLNDLSEGILPPGRTIQNVVKEENIFVLHGLKVNKDKKNFQQSKIPGQSEYTLFDFDLSTTSLISEDIPTTANNDIDDITSKMEHVTLFDKSNDSLLQNLSTYNKIEDTEFQKDPLDNQVSELNICETCREVNKPEEKEIDDLTTQLIENITAPIQLANPVEYPISESTISITERPEISHITEDLIETINLTPPIELIDSLNVNIANMNFGWSTDDPHSTKMLHDHGYSFQPDRNSIGFFQDKSLFFENIPTNASDEIKAEYRISQEDTSILPRQVNIPTAPAEDDTKSDESGLDVHSIEQDAKKDFPIYEEFVIEPSETDDDKIEYRERERSSDDPIPDVDTFTNRVERFKKMETSTDSNEIFLEFHKDNKTFDLPTSTSPAITIASYFDTGNYAVENHYKNSLTSPSTLISTTPMRIPPGFEEEFRRRLSGISTQDLLPGFINNKIAYIPDTTTQTHTTATLTFNSQNITYIPDTTTQTQALSSLTFVQSHNIESPNTCEAKVKSMVDMLIQEHEPPSTNERLPAFSNIVAPKSKIVEDEKDCKALFVESEPKQNINPKLESLPDPNNFFSSNVKSNDDTDAYNNFNRLSSYFTSPPKPDHSKSFFEVSQSQDHYRHKNPQHTHVSIQSNVKNFFENTALSATNTPTLNSNIPEGLNMNYNMNLVRDLASFKNFHPSEDVVKTVSYFTVEYGVSSRDFSIGEPKVSTNAKKDIDYTVITDCIENKNNQLGDVDENDIKIEDIVNNCKLCSDITKELIKLYVESVDFDHSKIKKAMDKNSESKKDGDTNMDVKKDSIPKKSMTVNFCDQLHEDSSDRIVLMAENRTSSEYAPVKHHWFYRVDFEGKSIWRGFSVADSRALENAFNSPDLDENTLVATDGGRYDVNIMARLRIAVYWTDKPTNVMRCSWFYKGTTDPRYVPYTESIADKLEEEYRHGVTTGEWHRRLMLPNNEMVVMHGPSVMVHFLQNTTNDAFTSTPLFAFGKRVYRSPPKIRVSEDQLQKIDHLVFMVHGAGENRHQKQKIQAMMRPRVVRRGCVESEIEDTEPSSIDHLLLMCHGVGSACDMRFRSVEEVVDDFRATSSQLIQSHYKNSYDNGLVGRVEVLPISWHSSLHSGETGVDRRLAAVTLESIPRLRNFTNDTILDVLFYTSPVFCQTIIETVCSELNRIYALFKKRNPDYKGGVSLSGHSLGSVILYDLLCHQNPKIPSPKHCSTEKQYVIGTAGTGQLSVKYPSLDFYPDTLYALGSPIAIFECIRGVETLGQEFCLPTCKKFFNIFHPYDPIAYRIEPMINPLLRDVKPFLIPHHKGRKRMHLELKDTMARVGADIKQKLIESIRSTWASMWKTQPPPDTHLEKVVEEEIEKEELNSECKEEQMQDHEVAPEMLGQLNGGRRIDHVLQEAPFEMINEYLFAMSSHVCYWESEDTMLVMLREIYGALGVSPDCSVPQNTLTVQRSRTPDDSLAPSSPESPSTSRGGS